MITAKPSTFGNSMSNTVLERIHQLIGNLVRTFNISTKPYVDKNDPWSGILDTAEFVISSTTNRKKIYSPGKLIFGRDMIITIKHTVYWELIIQRKRTKTNKDNIHKNRHRVGYEYIVGDDVMLTNHAI